MTIEHGMLALAGAVLVTFSHWLVGMAAFATGEASADRKRLQRDLRAAVQLRAEPPGAAHFAVTPNRTIN